MFHLMATTLSSLVLATILVSYTTEACNEAVCASIVSKCMITQSCKCDMKNCTCCKDCLNCLSYLWTECCSCVDLCPKPNSTATSELSKQSHVEDLTDAIPTLFKVLTSESDTLHRFDTITFPVDFPLAQFKPQFEKEIKYKMQSSEQETTDPLTAVTLNCTVAYMSTCMSWSKCKTSCRSMGSTSVRWFHDGCCECIGDTCINYGINQSRCQNCTTVAISHLSPDQMDYGEDDDEDETPPAQAPVSSEVTAGTVGTSKKLSASERKEKKGEEDKIGGGENKTETVVR
uniref:Protein twisted gastrulation n=1 Tax=Cacopsylla melanoneura TaxID=428564 RepID=A0A8D8RWT1_9HEMI